MQSRRVFGRREGAARGRAPSGRAEPPRGSWRAARGTARRTLAAPPSQRTCRSMRMSTEDAAQLSEVIVRVTIRARPAAESSRRSAIAAPPHPSSRPSIPRAGPAARCARGWKGGRARRTAASRRARRAERRLRLSSPPAAPRPASPLHEHSPRSASADCPLQQSFGLSGDQECLDRGALRTLWGLKK